MADARRTIYANAKGCILGTSWCATTSLLGCAAACRVCGLSADLGLVLANKTVSSPFALAGATALGKFDSLALEITTLDRRSSMLNFCASAFATGANAALTVTYVIVSGMFFTTAIPYNYYIM